MSFKFENQDNLINNLLMKKLVRLFFYYKKAYKLN